MYFSRNTHCPLDPGDGRSFLAPWLAPPQKEKDIQLCLRSFFIMVVSLPRTADIGGHNISSAMAHFEGKFLACCLVVRL